MKLCIKLGIYDMPIEDQKRTKDFFELFKHNLKDLVQNEGEYDFSPNYITIILDLKEEGARVFKGPKLTANGNGFKKKYENTFEKDGYLYGVETINFGKTVQLALDKTIKYHRWSVLMRWNSNLTCTRPIFLIECSLDDKLLPGKINNLEFKPFSNMLKSQESRIRYLNKLQQEFKTEPLIDTLYLFENPKPIITYFNEKFLELPIRLLKFILAKEQCFYIKNNTFLVFTESYVDVSPEKFNIGINSRLLDIYLMFQRDKMAPLKDHEKTPYVDAIIQDVFQQNSSLVHLYKLDQTTEIVSEYPEMEGVITAYKKNITFNINDPETMDEFMVFIGDLIYDLNHLVIPTSEKDPFGLKKRTDKAIQLCLKFKQYLTFSKFNQATYFVKNRFYLFLSKYNPILENIITDKIIDCLDFQFNLNGFNRIKNLIAKTYPQRNIILNPHEEDLIKKIHQMTLVNVNDVIDKINDYLDKNIVGQYFERYQILLKFISQLNTFFKI